MNLTINNTNINPLATLLFRDGQGLLPAGLSFEINWRWQGTAPSRRAVLLLQVGGQLGQGKRVTTQYARDRLAASFSAKVPAMARVLLDTGDRPSLGAVGRVFRALFAAPFMGSGGIGRRRGMG